MAMKMLIAVLVAVLFNYATSQYTQDCECGLENIQTRIIGGHAATQGKHPWVASVLIPADGGYALCTGSLINDKYILTAAACLPKQGLDVSKFLVSIKTYTSRQYAKNRLQVKSYVAKADYKPFEADNVALIELAERVNITEVSPICLPSFDPSDVADNSNPLYVEGFGFTDLQGTQTKQLNEIDVKEIESMDCMRRYENATGNFLNIKKLLCGEADDGNGIAQGDFGAPLAVRDGHQVYQAGIASFYYTDFDTGKKLFDMYERITPHIKWISDHTSADANWCRAPSQAIQPKEDPEIEKRKVEAEVERRRLAQEEEDRKQAQLKKEKEEREAEEERQRQAEIDAKKKEREDAQKPPTVNPFDEEEEQQEQQKQEKPSASQSETAKTGEAAATPEAAKSVPETESAPATNTDTTSGNTATSGTPDAGSSATDANQASSATSSNDEAAQKVQEGTPGAFPSRR